MQSGSISNLNLEGDGVLEDIFHLLWRKDDFGHSPHINIPDTVIFKNRKPMCWYFMSKEGIIKKKNKDNMNTHQIEDVFSRNQQDCEIVAYFLHTDTETHEATIEYFDRIHLHSFLNGETDLKDGVLQKFVEPYGVKNSMMQAIWSPQVVLVEKRENFHSIYDKRYSLYERAVTFEGSANYSAAEPVRGSNIPDMVKQACQDIVEHINALSYQKINISRLAVNLKLDAANRLWVLWVTSLRKTRTTITKLDPEAGNLSSVKRTVKPSALGPVSLEPNFQVPRRVQETFGPIGARRSVESPKSAGTPKSADAKKRAGALFSCPSCYKEVAATKFHQVSYRTLIAQFEYILRVLAKWSSSDNVEWPPSIAKTKRLGGVGLGPLVSLREKIEACSENGTVYKLTAEDTEIPPVIHATHAEMSAADFNKFRRDPLFTSKTLSVCENCYLAFVDVQNSEIVPVHIQEPVSHNEQMNERIEAKKSRAIQNYCSRVQKPRMDQQNKIAREKKLVELARQQIQQSYLEGPPVPQGSLPSLPPRIDEFSIGSILVSNEDNSERYDESQAELSADFRDELRSRENSFFRDLYKNSNTTGHPLSHVVATHARLAMIEDGIGKSEDTRQKSAGTYSPVSKRRQQQAAQSRKNIDSAKAQNRTQKLVDMHDDEAASREHVAFLKEALAAVREQLNDPSSLEQAIALRSMANRAVSATLSGTSFNSIMNTRETYMTNAPSPQQVYRKSFFLGDEELDATLQMGEDSFTINIERKFETTPVQTLQVPISEALQYAPRELANGDDLVQFIFRSLVEDENPENDQSLVRISFE